MNNDIEEYLEIEEGDTISFEIDDYGIAQGEVTYVEHTPEHKDIDVETKDGLWTLQLNLDGERLTGVLYENLETMEEKANGRVVEIENQ